MMENLDKLIQEYEGRIRIAPDQTALNKINGELLGLINAGTLPENKFRKLYEEHWKPRAKELGL